jgi:transcriptional regulator with XRE-family HTH domain
MSIVQYGATNGEGSPEVSVPAADDRRPLQRLAMVRRLQGLSRRTVARRMNLEVDEVRKQERQTADLPLSALYAWQKALDVPIGELLVEAGDSLVSPVLERSRLVRLMKTVLAVQQQAKQESIRRMAQTMAGQLVDIMPELAEVGVWNINGKQRRRSELGVAAQRRLSDEMFVSHDDDDGRLYASFLGGGSYADGACERV